VAIIAKKWPTKRGGLSLEGDNLIVFYSLNATKRGGLS
jgi:hypothetical protein